MNTGQGPGNTVLFLEGIQIRTSPDKIWAITVNVYGFYCYI